MATYKITKNNIDGTEINYGGGYSIEDVKLLTKGYKFDGMIYNRKRSNWFFIVEEELEPSYPENALVTYEFTNSQGEMIHIVDFFGTSTPAKSLDELFELRGLSFKENKIVELYCW